jgi:GGDEF domain-containing protein
MPASAHVIAAEPSRVLEVGCETFWEIVHESHEFAVNLLVMVAGRLRQNNTTVSTNIRLQREYKRNAMVDALTGLYNRRWLDDMLPRFVGRYGRSGQPFALLMVDVDHFKKVNDTYGHPAGDCVLVSVAHTLRAEVRPGDHVARYGGEEFAIIPFPYRAWCSSWSPPPTGSASCASSLCSALPRWPRTRLHCGSFTSQSCPLGA